MNEFTLEEIDAQAAEAVGGTHILIKAGEGEPFRMEHPMFRSPETEDLLEPLEETDTEGIARVLIGGDEEYERFIAAGGTAAHINRTIFVVSQRFQDVQKGRPTRSQKSSGPTPRRSKRR